MARVLFLACCGINAQLASSQVTMMVDDALDLAYPKERIELHFSLARFSHDGEFLAFAINNVTLGDPEQVWLYEMRSHRLIAVTEKPRQSVQIQDLAWSDDGTLYVKALRLVNVERVFFLAVKNGQTREIDQPLPQIAERFDRRARLQCCEERNDSYVVKATKGHGYYSLSMRLSQQTALKAIATGGGELETFLFDPVRSQVRYPERVGSTRTLVTLDLGSRQSRSLQLQNGADLRLLDQTRDATLIAYTVAGSCLVKPSPDNQLNIGEPHRLCFVRPE
jgi:hypothetical protein